MNKLLNEIVKNKRATVEKTKIKMPEGELRKKLHQVTGPKDFLAKINNPGKIRIISEIKAASPSAGIIKKDFNVAQIAIDYKEAGTSALSILTEEHYFNGDLYHILEAKKASDMPILRKDFIIDNYQILESLVFGADAVLLIVRLLTLDALSEMYETAKSLGMHSIVEVHNENDLEAALKVNPEIIGINNRDLDTLKVDTKTTFKLLPGIPKDKVIVAESGLKTLDDIIKLKNTGRVNAALIGETFLKQKNIKEFTKQFVNAGK